MFGTRTPDAVTFDLGHNEKMQVSIALGAVHDWLRDGTNRLNRTDMQHVTPEVIGWLLEVFGQPGQVTLTKHPEEGDRFDFTSVWVVVATPIDDEAENSRGTEVYTFHTRALRDEWVEQAEDRDEFEGYNFFLTMSEDFEYRVVR